MASRTVPLDRISVFASIEHLIDALLTPDDVASVLRTASACLARIDGVEDAGVAHLDPLGTEQLFMSSSSSGPALLHDDTPASYVARSGEPMKYRLAEQPPAPDGIDAAVWEQVYRANCEYDESLVLPLLAGEASMGSIWFFANGFELFDDWFLEQARAAGAIIAMAFERVHESAKARKQLDNITNVNAVLSASNREFEDFAKMASSDLQNPLRKIIGFGDRLERSAVHQLTERELDYLSRIHSASDRMQNLISDLLRFSCVHSEDAPPENVDLTYVLCEVLSDLEVALNESGGTLKIDQLPVVYGNPTQLRQVFQNLVGNAIKFRDDERAPNIVVSAVESASEHCVAIEVVDNGIGFDMAFHDRIFKPFQRLHGVQDYKGSGIGLSVCRRIVERHEGTLAATSVVGEGTTFTVTLPKGEVA